MKTKNFSILTILLLFNTLIPHYTTLDEILSEVTNCVIQLSKQPLFTGAQAYSYPCKVFGLSDFNECSLVYLLHSNSLPYLSEGYPQISMFSADHEDHACSFPRLPQDEFADPIEQGLEMACPTTSIQCTAGILFMAYNHAVQNLFAYWIAQPIEHFEQLFPQAQHSNYVLFAKESKGIKPGLLINLLAQQLDVKKYILTYFDSDSKILFLAIEKQNFNRVQHKLRFYSEVAPLR